KLVATPKEHVPAASPRPASPSPSSADTVDHPIEAGHTVPAGAAAGTSLVTIPGYEVERELGRGGMGVIYLARQLEPPRLVAVKMVLAGEHAGPEQLARFRTEAETAARLQHPNIITIHQVGESQGRPYLSLEYVEGGSLAQHLKGRQLQPGERGWRIED